MATCRNENKFSCTDSTETECPECGAPYATDNKGQLDFTCDCFNSGPIDSGWGDAPIHGYDY